MIPFTPAVVFALLGGVGKHLFEEPIIHRAIENWLENNSWKKWDVWLWHLFESAVDIKSPPAERGAVLENVASAVQDQYEEVKALVADGQDEYEAFEQVTGAKIKELMGSE